MPRKNPNIKRAGDVNEFTPEQIMELKKCSQDPVYFITKYVKVQHPLKGLVPFVLRDYQIKMIEAYQNNRFAVVLSARQTGKSVTAAAFVLWYSIFPRWIMRKGWIGTIYLSRLD